MKTAPSQCDTQKLLRYHDGELSAEEHDRTAGHLAQCAECRKALHQQQQIRRTVQGAAEIVAAQTPRPDVEGRLLAKIKGPGKINRNQRGFWTRRRWIPAGALATALLAVMIINGPWRQSVQTMEPSAIVESFQGNVSTVMILETQTTGQTIVWFNEINEPNGESDGYQSAPPAVDRSAHPAADEQRGLGRA